MDFYIPTESDFRKWIKEALKECVEEFLQKNVAVNEKGEELMSREQVAAILDISLVTLTEWMRKGLPYHKPNGRVYFIKEEVMNYIKQEKIVKGRHR